MRPSHAPQWDDDVDRVVSPLISPTTLLNALLVTRCARCGGVYIYVIASKMGRARPTHTCHDIAARGVGVRGHRRRRSRVRRARRLWRSGSCSRTR
mmetsp:Transcript_7940/g.26253  ORF Transcript_7940/g.26253 Transcript_7940/m.26253 type:complete len:96 (-) Transcript_7940:226-513(-)